MNEVDFMKHTRLVVSFVTAMVLAAVGVAQKTVERGAMDRKNLAVQAMHKTAPEMEKLKDLLGTWTTTEKHEPSKWSHGGEGKGSSVARLGPGGFSIMEDYTSTMPMGPFIGHGVTVWDATERVYKLYWFDSMIPVALEQDCRWEASDFVCMGEMTIEGKRIKSKITTTGITPISHILTYESSSDGGPMKKMMTITHTKSAE